MMSSGIITSLAGVLAATALYAERVDCTLTSLCEGADCAGEPIPVHFEIDRNQFTAPIDGNEPPQVKVTHVDMDGVRFAAEPIVIGQTLGFWEDAQALGARMLVMQPDGQAKYSETATGRRLSGRCEVTP